MGPGRKEYPAARAAARAALPLRRPLFLRRGRQGHAALGRTHARRSAWGAAPHGHAEGRSLCVRRSRAAAPPPCAAPLLWLSGAAGVWPVVGGGGCGEGDDLRKMLSRTRTRASTRTSTRTLAVTTVRIGVNDGRVHPCSPRARTAHKHTEQSRAGQGRAAPLPFAHAFAGMGQIGESVRKAFKTGTFATAGRLKLNRICKIAR